MSVHVRRAGPGDADLLARLHRACFDEAWDADAFRGLLDNPGAFALLAEAARLANDSQAFIVVRVAADEAEILTLATAPAARRKGLAHILLKEAAREAARLGARAMFLEVAQDNGPARALYDSAGFAAIGGRRAYYHRPDGKAADALMLRAALPL